MAKEFSALRSQVDALQHLVLNGPSPTSSSTSTSPQRASFGGGAQAKELPKVIVAQIYQAVLADVVACPLNNIKGKNKSNSAVGLVSHSDESTHASARLKTLHPTGFSGYSWEQIESILGDSDIFVKSKYTFARKQLNKLIKAAFDEFKVKGSVKHCDLIRLAIRNEENTLDYPKIHLELSRGVAKALSKLGFGQEWKVTFSSTQEDLDMIIASANVDYKFFAYCVLVVNVYEGDFDDFRSSTNKVELADLNQGYFYWFIVDSWCVYCTTNRFITYKGLEVPNLDPAAATSSSDTSDSTVSVSELAAKKMSDLLQVLPGRPTSEQQEEKYTRYFFNPVVAVEVAPAPDADE